MPVTGFRATDEIRSPSLREDRRTAVTNRLACLSLLFALLLCGPLLAQNNTKQTRTKKKKSYVKIEGVGPVNIRATFRIENNDKVFYGRPIGQDNRSVALLRWDGRVEVLPKQSRYEVFSKGFAPYTHDEIKKRMEKQYGNRYQVQTSKHFVVVHPRTNRRQWAKQYEAVYRQYESWFKKRGITIAEPQFPLIVVVLGSRTEFDRALVGQALFKKDVFGFYARPSNRVTTFVSNDPRLQRQVERVANLTVIHEAIHQIAFNTGVHNRLCKVPRWTSEGFAMLFESSGFRRDSPKDDITDRVNRRRLQTLKKSFVTGRATGQLENIIRNDRVFVSNPEMAYGLACGLSFYLAEKEKDKYLDFVIKDSSQNEFGNYTPSERMKLFLETFKTDPKTLEKRLQKFILAIP